MKKYLIDTSIWIDYFANTRSELNDKIDGLIDENSICINGIIKTELLHGAKNEKDFNNLQNYLKGLIFLEIDQALFDKITYNGFLLKKSGISIPINDLIIATQCVENDLLLIEKDKHYKMVEKVLNLKRYFK